MQKKCECPHCTCTCDHCRKKEQQIINAGNLFKKLKENWKKFKKSYYTRKNNNKF